MAWDIPRRSFRMRLFDGRGEMTENKVLSDLDIRAKVTFNTTASVSGAVTEANITINGLTRDKMNFLSTTSMQWAQPRILNEIQIEAGYDGQTGIIFAGNVIQATPSLDNADYSLTIKALSTFNVMLDTVKSYSFKGAVPVSEIAGKFAQDTGLILIDGIKDPTLTVADYAVQKQSVINHIRILAKTAGINIWPDNGRLNMAKIGEALENVREYKVTAVNMIGSPQPTDSGCNVKVRLDPSLVTGGLVTLESLKFPELNRERYILQTLFYSGDTRGNDWSATLNLVKEGVIRG